MCVVICKTSEGASRRGRREGEKGRKEEKVKGIEGCVRKTIARGLQTKPRSSSLEGSEAATEPRGRWETRKRMNAGSSLLHTHTHTQSLDWGAAYHDIYCFDPWLPLLLLSVRSSRPRVRRVISGVLKYSAKEKWKWISDFFFLQIRSPCKHH